MKKFLLPLIFLIAISCKQPQQNYSQTLPLATKVIDTINADGSLNLYAFGAKMDGIFDDSPAAERAIAYARTARAKSRELQIPTNGILRLTREPVIGGDFIPLELCYKNIDSVDCYRCNYGAFLDGARVINMQIKGKGESCIYADFNNPDKLQAAILFGAMKGESQLGKQQYNLEISNVGIYAQGYFKNGKRVFEKVDYSKNNCVGIAALFAFGLTVKNVTMVGFKEGILLNNAYFFDVTNVTTYYSQRASFDIRCHRGSYNNITNGYCDKGNEIRSNKIMVNGLYSLGCKTGLHVAGSNNILSSVYLESGTPGDGQLIIGDSPNDKIVLKDFIYGVRFEDLTISYPYKVGITFKENVRRITINEGLIQSQTFVFKDTLTKVKVENVQGTLSGKNWVKSQYVDLYGNIVKF